MSWRASNHESDETVEFRICGFGQPKIPWKSLCFVWVIISIWRRQMMRIGGRCLQRDDGRFDSFVWDGLGVSEERARLGFWFSSLGDCSPVVDLVLVC